MYNPKIILVLVVAFAIVGLGAYKLSQNSSSPEPMMETGENITPKEGQAMMEKIDDKMMAEARYVEYSKTVLEKAETTRRVLFFYASWCSTCKPADAGFAQNLDKIPEDVTLIRVNYNDPETDQEEKDLAKKYGITYQHTFVQIDNTGKEITKWNGGQIDELLSNIK